ncbi:MAG: hypothetical protein ABI640_08375 [Gammaproteobacteria bacterium]
MSATPTFWFPVKKYGWGWGLPVRWQGWVVFVAYLVLILFGMYHFLPERNALALFAYICGMTVLLTAIVVVKGERPVAWRWGGK